MYYVTMNNLKFRAYFEQYERMIDNIGIINQNMILVDFTNSGELEPIFITDKIHVMQSTGLFDKNGKEIFIGDIVKFPDLYGFYDFEGGLTSVDGLNVASVVKKGSYITLDNFVSENGATERELENYECTFDDLDFKNLEVIGNIYEDKELLG